MVDTPELEEGGRGQGNIEEGTSGCLSVSMVYVLVCYVRFFMSLFLLPFFR